MIAFCHIEKTAGTTVNYLLFEEFGLHHCHVKKWKSKYQLREKERPFLSSDLKKLRLFYPKLKSIAGHCIKPYSDLNQIEPKIQFLTFLRNPLFRTISHYHHRLLRGQTVEAFESWISDSKRHNWQTNFIAGRGDIKLAIEIMSERLLVGIQEKFNESLITIWKIPGLERPKTRIKEHNVSPLAGVQEEILTNKKLRKILEDANELDIKLYEYDSKKLFPLQIEKARKESKTRFASKSRSNRIKRAYNRYVGVAFNKFIYRTSVGIFRQFQNWKE